MDIQQIQSITDSNITNLNDAINKFNRFVNKIGIDKYRDFIYNNTINVNNESIIPFLLVEGDYLNEKTWEVFEEEYLIKLQDNQLIHHAQQG